MANMADLKHAHLAQPMNPEFETFFPPLQPMLEAMKSLPLEELRAAMRQRRPLPEWVPAEHGLIYRDIKTDDGAAIELKIFVPKSEERRRPMFLMLHGGGWAIGSHGIEEPLSQMICAIGVIVVSVDYRLAPEHPYPTPLDDCMAALKWIKGHAQELAGDPNRIIVGGSSAGGNLAAAVAQRARDEGIPGIIGHVLNIPATCHQDLLPRDKYEMTSYEQNEDAPILSKERMMFFWNKYVPDPKSATYASPLLAESLEKLPPAIVSVCGMDPLRDEGIAYAEALKAAGVPVTLETYAGVPHGFHAFAPDLDISKQFMERSVSWVKELLGKTAFPAIL